MELVKKYSVNDLSKWSFIKYVSKIETELSNALGGTTKVEVDYEVDRKGGLYSITPETRDVTMKIRTPTLSQKGEKIVGLYDYANKYAFLDRTEEVTGNFDRTLGGNVRYCFILKDNKGGLRLSYIGDKGLYGGVLKKFGEILFDVLKTNNREFKKIGNERGFYSLPVIYKVIDNTVNYPNISTGKLLERSLSYLDKGVNIRNKHQIEKLINNGLLPDKYWYYSKTEVKYYIDNVKKYLKLGNESRKAHEVGSVAKGEVKQFLDKRIEEDGEVLLTVRGVDDHIYHLKGKIELEDETIETKFSGFVASAMMDSKGKQTFSLVGALVTQNKFKPLG